MTTKQLRLTRGLFTIAISIITIAIYTIIIKALPCYFNDYKALRVIAKIFRVISFLMLFFGAGALLSKDTEEDEEEMRYGPVYMLAIYETISFILYLFVRIFGYHGFYAFGDNMGILVAILAIILIAMLCLIRSVRCRRLLFENKSWRKIDDEEVVKMLTTAGIVFSAVALITIGSVEMLTRYMFKPSHVVDGYGYVELGLKSGTKWSDRNLFSTGHPNAGLKTYLEGLSIEGNIVTEFMGEEWAVPTKQQWDELIGTCKSVPSYYHGEYGFTFIGRNKFKRLFIPAPDSDLHNHTTYWTSSAADPNNSFDYVLDNDINYSKRTTVQFLSLEYLPWGLIRNGDSYLYNKCYVRPVIERHLK